MAAGLTQDTWPSCPGVQKGPGLLSQGPQRSIHRDAQSICSLYMSDSKHLSAEVFACGWLSAWHLWHHPVECIPNTSATRSLARCIFLHFAGLYSWMEMCACALAVITGMQQAMFCPCTRDIRQDRYMYTHSDRCISGGSVIMHIMCRIVQVPEQ